MVLVQKMEVHSNHILLDLFCTLSTMDDIHRWHFLAMDEISPPIDDINRWHISSMYAICSTMDDIFRWPFHPECFWIKIICIMFFFSKQVPYMDEINLIQGWTNPIHTHWLLYPLWKWERILVCPVVISRQITNNLCNLVLEDPNFYHCTVHDNRFSI